MPIVTLTTDYGLRDPYAAQLKGAVLSADPTTVIVDLTHEVAPYDIAAAAYHLGHTWRHFPPGATHVCTVNRLADNAPEPLIGFRQNGHTFLCPDNGLPSLLFPRLEAPVYRLHPGEGASTKSTLTRALRTLSLGLDVRHAGELLPDPERSIRAEPVAHPEYIRGSILHIDGYGNAVLNIHRDLVERLARGRRVQTVLPNADPIVDIVDHYHDVPNGELLTRYNSRGYLEIAMNAGKAAQLYGLERDQLVQLEFEV